MSDDADVIFRSFGQRFRPDSAVVPALVPSPASPEDEISAYSTTNPASRRQQISLELRWKKGNTYALSYAYFVGVGLDGGTMTIDFTGFKVTLKGKNLVELKDKVRFQLVEFIQEVDEFSDRARNDPKAVAVYSIKLDKL